MADEQSPFYGVTDFFSEMNRMREIGRHGYGHTTEDRQRDYSTAWVPAADIFSRDGDLVIRVEVAGLDPDDVNVTFSQGVLSVSGNRRTAMGTGGDESFYVRERFFGTFRRSVTLPEGTTDDDIGAEFENGLLEVVVRGGARTAVPRRIAIQRRTKGSAA